MLSGCGYDSCMALNDRLDRDLYYWKENKCNVNPCNENTYQMCDESECNDLSYRFKYDTKKKQCEEIINKQGESNTEPTSMAKIYQEYLDEGGYKNVCKPNDFETCEVGTDLQPRYYCKEGFFVKENEGIDGDSNHCIDPSLLMLVIIFPTPPPTRKADVGLSSLFVIWKMHLKIFFLIPCRQHPTASRTRRTCDGVDHHHQSLSPKILHKKTHP
jgi:hypothetical protein